MYLNRQTARFICQEHDTVEFVLQKLEENKKGVMFVVNSNEELIGSVNDGDVRRAILNGDIVDKKSLIGPAIRKNCAFARVGDTPSQLKTNFREGVNIIPVIDTFQKIQFIVDINSEVFKIGDTEISEHKPAFIIAEIGNNHQGNVDSAFKLIDIAKSAGVNCVKFQHRNLETVYGNGSRNSSVQQDLGTQYTLNLLRKYQLPTEELFRAFDYAKQKNLEVLCTPWDNCALEELETYGLAGYKVASADLTNFDLLQNICDTGKPIICSTGMSTEAEIEAAIALFKSNSAQFSMLHCNSTYPSPYKDIGLNFLKKLEDMSGRVVGYSGHERGVHIPIAAVALGARIIEKHITLDKSLEGNDHKVSLLPNELNQMVLQIRQLEEALGNSGEERTITQGELINRENLAKSVFFRTSLKKGDIISREHVEIRSPGHGIQPSRMAELIGTTAKRDYTSGDCVFHSDIDGFITKRKYTFDRPFGVPVRYHDFEKITAGTNLDFVEFHLSYDDLKEDYREYIKKDQKMNFAVHCPELFENDHIVDLVSDDDNYRQESIKKVNQVLNLTRELNTLFPLTINPVVVLNAGGWSRDTFLSQYEKIQKYEILSASLKHLDTKNINLAIQTMPPFPWHFGGQSHHNLFVDPTEIADFCSKNEDISICLDVSHSMMACTYYEWNFGEFIKKIGAQVSHLHIVDATGADGEGVEIGKGDINFKKLFEILNCECPNVQFIPEIWQGHKNEGEGFWKALEFLEKCTPK